MPEPIEKKIIKCPKCKYVDRAKETCPACGGSGELTLTKVIPSKKRVVINTYSDWGLN